MDSNLPGSAVKKLQVGPPAQLDVAHRDVLDDPKAACLAALIARRMPSPPKQVLVVGCGSGIEAAILARQLDARVVGIDLNDRFDPSAAQFARLQQGDACSLDFNNECFDLVYSYHALEHIPNHRQALREMCRVLKVGAWYCVGTPNRSRVVGYLGSANVSLLDKLKWNYDDWCARLAGRFRNDLGAHAGFTERELRYDLEMAFGEVNSITLEYYLAVYRQHASLISLLSVLRASSLLFPSVYFMGRRIRLAVQATSVDSD